MRAAIILICFVVYVQGSENLLNTDLHKCFKCICHARTGCWSRITCARYNITEDVWKKANRPYISLNNDENSSLAYSACVQDENCILNIIKSYTDSFQLRRECTTDGLMDCRDRAALFMFGTQYNTKSFEPGFRIRYNKCAEEINYPKLDDYIKPLKDCEDSSIPAE